MQVGSVPIERRKHGPDVWSFRWRETGPAGRRVHRRIVLGSAEELKSLASARKMVVGLRREINVHDVRIRKESITLNDLSRHYQQRELVDRNQRISCAAAMTRSDEYRSPEDWLFASPRPLALPGTTDHAAPYPSCCAKAEHQQANRLAHLSPYIFHASSI